MFKHMAMWTWPGAFALETPERIIERLRAAHIDVVIPYLGLRADQATRAAHEDRLGALLEEAHRHGMQVIACFDEMGTYDAMPAKDCCQVRQDGEKQNLLCPAHPGAREYLLGELDRVLGKFAFDGVNLEDSYVYNNTTLYDPAHSGGAAFNVIPVCYCDYCRAHAPIEQPGWQQWKTDRMTELIAAQAQVIQARRPGIPFSVAARMPYARDDFYAQYQDEVPYYDGWQYCQSRDGLSADWVEWLRRGIIQFACPMSYFSNTRLVELETLECQYRIPNAQETIWIGLGLDVITAEYAQGYRDFPDPDDTRKDVFKNDGPALRRQLDMLTRLGQQNVVFFSHEFLKDEAIAAIAEYR
ncbi:MAG: family 10 glycosylhydrolase [Armatimonadota bacterium]